MLVSVYVIFLGLGLVLTTTDVDDFDDKQHGYEIIFHDRHDLLLAIHHDTCYFVGAPDDKEDFLVNATNSGILTSLTLTENSLVYHLTTNHSGEVMPTTLERMRQKYSDLLADFHCKDKEVFEVNYDYPVHPTHHYPGETHKPTHSPTHGPTHGPTHSTHIDYQNYCHSRADGRYADPNDCHHFFLCTNGRTFYELCGAGSAFLNNLLPCVQESQVPACRKH